MSFEYDVRSIVHGSQKVGYKGKGKNDQFHRSTGVNSFAPSIDQDSTDIYADGQVHFTISNPAVLTIEQANYQYTDLEMLQNGYLGTSATGFTDNGRTAPFDVQRVLKKELADGTSTWQLDVYYNARVTTVPTESDDEDEDSINPKLYTRTITVAGDQMDDGDGNTTLVKHFQITRSEENAAVFDTYETAILRPEDFASKEPTDVKVTGITFDPDTDTVSVAVGKSVTVALTVEPDNATNKKVTVESSDDAVATASLSGNTITITGVAAGDTHVTASIYDGGGYINNEVAVTVTASEEPDPETTEVQPTNITADQNSVSVAVGKSATVTLTVEPADATNKKVDAESRDNAIATASVSGNTVTITGVAKGETTVHATTDNKELFITADIAVTVTD